MIETEATKALLAWYEQNKRDLPWRKTTDPYAIWLSEIMLQQTRVQTVIVYYHRFLAAFPTVFDLASASEERVFKLWEGLGYYSRARNLHKAAKIIVSDYNGCFPADYRALLKLPGIGTYTAGAVASFAFSLPYPAIDGNVTRVASRFLGIRENVAIPSVQKALYASVAEMIPQDNASMFNQAIMELGATLCGPVAPRCEACPLHGECSAYLEGDADSLPVHEKKAAPKRMAVGVALLEWQGKILLMKRRERMLGGLYVFFLAEDAESPSKTVSFLKESGIAAGEAELLGNARHVFTHRIWEMHIALIRLKEPPSMQWMEEHEARFVNQAELQELPMPSAMKVAKALALERLGF